MSPATKVTLVVLVILLGLLGGYYAMIGPGEDPLLPEEGSGSSPAATETETGTPASRPQGQVHRGARSGRGVNQPVRPAVTPARSSPPEGPRPSGQVAGTGGSPPWQSDQLDAAIAADLRRPERPVGAGELRRGGAPGGSVAGSDPPVANPTQPVSTEASYGRGPAAGPGAPSLEVFVPRAPSAARSTPSPTVEYTVKSGDSLWTIAQSWFGDGAKWDLIARTNPLIDPNQLRVGMKLRLPAKDAATPPAIGRAPATAARPAAPAGNKVHTVASGDTLTRIASNYFGDPGKWRVIYEANRSTIGGDPDALQLGMKLTIPPAMQSASANR